MRKNYQLLSYTLLFLFALTFLPANAQYKWGLKGLDIDSIKNSYVREISVVSPSVAWALASGDDGSKKQRFSKTTDGGLSWASGIIDIEEGFLNLSIFALNKDTAWITVFHEKNINSRIYRTNDGGKTWDWQSSADFAVLAVFIHFYDKDNGLAFDGSDLLSTKDGGLTWEPQFLFTNLNTIFQDACAVQGDNIWIGDVAGKVLISNNRGKSWRSSSQNLTDNNMSPFAIKAISFADANNGMIIGWTIDSLQSSDDGIFFTTTDGGDNWIKGHFKGFDQLFNTGKWDLAYVPKTTGTYVVTSGLGSAITHNAGNSWQLIDNDHSFSAVAFSDSSTGFAGGFISHPANGIFKWENSNSVSVSSVYVSPYHLYPNPASDQLFFHNGDLASVVMTMTDAEGRLILSRNIDAGSTAEINTSAYNRGLYVIQCGDRSFKVIIE